MSDASDSDDPAPVAADKPLSQAHAAAKAGSFTPPSESHGPVPAPLIAPCTKRLANPTNMFRHMFICPKLPCTTAALAILSPTPLDDESPIPELFRPLILQERTALTRPINGAGGTNAATSGSTKPDHHDDDVTHTPSAEGRASALLAAEAAKQASTRATLVTRPGSTASSPAPADCSNILGQLECTILHLTAESSAASTNLPQQTTWELAVQLVVTHWPTLLATPTPAWMTTASTPDAPRFESLLLCCGVLQSTAARIAADTASHATTPHVPTVPRAAQLDQDLGEEMHYPSTVYTTAVPKTQRGVLSLGHPTTKVQYSLDFTPSDQRPYVLVARLTRVDDSRIFCCPRASTELAAWHSTTLRDCPNASTILLNLRTASPSPLASFAPAVAFVAQPSGPPSLPIAALSQALVTMAAVYERAFGRDHALTEAFSTLIEHSSLQAWYAHHLDPDGARRLSPIASADAVAASHHVASLFDSAFAQWHRASMTLLWSAFDSASRTRQDTVPYGMCHLPNFLTFHPALPSTSTVAMTRMSLPFTLPTSLSSRPHLGGAGGPSRHPVPPLTTVATARVVTATHDVVTSGWPPAIVSLINSHPTTWASAVASVPSLASLRAGSKQVCGRFLLFGPTACSGPGSGCSRAHVAPPPA